MQMQRSRERESQRLYSNVENVGPEGKGNARTEEKIKLVPKRRKSIDNNWRSIEAIWIARERKEDYQTKVIILFIVSK